MRCSIFGAFVLPALVISVEYVPIFIKLNKVGGTTVSTFLECHLGDTLGKLARNAKLKPAIPLQQFTGLWGHGPMINYAHSNSSADDMLRRFGKLPLRVPITITVLRHPVERFFSFVTFYFHPPFIKGYEKQYNLVQALMEYPNKATARDVSTVYDAVQERFSSDPNMVRLEQYVDVFGKPPLKNARDWALKTLSKFDVVGLTEEIDQMLLFIVWKLNWPSSVLCSPLGRMRVGSYHGSETKLVYTKRYSPSVIRELKSRLRSEIILYQAAVTLHKLQLSTIPPEDFNALSGQRNSPVAHETCVRRRSKIEAVMTQNGKEKNAKIANSDITRVCRAWRNF